MTVRDKTRSPINRAQGPQLDCMRRNRYESRRLWLADLKMFLARRVDRGRLRLRAGGRASLFRNPLCSAPTLHLRNQLRDSSSHCTGFRISTRQITDLSRWCGHSRSRATRALVDGSGIPTNLVFARSTATQRGPFSPTLGMSQLRMHWRKPSLSTQVHQTHGQPRIPSITSFEGTREG